MADHKPECERTLREIYQYLDGEVVQEVHVRIERHLGTCEPCKELAEFRREIKRMMAHKCTGDALPAGLRERILDQLTRIEAEPSSPPEHR